MSRATESAGKASTEESLQEVAVRGARRSCVAGFQPSACCRVPGFPGGPSAGIASWEAVRQNSRRARYGQDGLAMKHVPLPTARLPLVLASDSDDIQYARIRFSRLPMSMHELVRNWPHQVVRCQLAIDIIGAITAVPAYLDFKDAVGCVLALGASARQPAWQRTYLLAAIIDAATVGKVDFPTS